MKIQHFEVHPGSLFGETFLEKTRHMSTNFQKSTTNPCDLNPRTRKHTSRNTSPTSGILLHSQATRIYNIEFTNGKNMITRQRKEPSSGGNFAKIRPDLVNEHITYAEISQNRDPIKLLVSLWFAFEYPPNGGPPFCGTLRWSLTCVFLDFVGPVFWVTKRKPNHLKCGGQR